MTSEIQQELNDNYSEMKDLMEKQKFSVKHARAFLRRYYNIIRKMEDLEKSRDSWKKKYFDMKELRK